MSTLPTGIVTFLFTDIEGSTRLALRTGADFAGLIDRHHALTRSAMARVGGTTVSTEGDAFFVVFNDPVAAIVAAADAQERLASEPWPGGESVRVRMGIHTGEGRLGGDSYAGPDVNRAARIAAAGHGGQVLVSASSRALAFDALPAHVALRDLGEHRLKDLPTAERLYQLDIAGLPSVFPPLRAQGQGNLPEPVTSFIGRTAAVAAVAQFLEGARLVTLTGPGGTGKTRLSIEVARGVAERFPDGAWFVRLETVRDPEMVVPAIASVLMVTEEAGRTADETLIAHLQGRRLLLVLDNLEQVVVAADRIGRLVAAAPDLRVLASSREILRLSAEQEFPVPPLESDPAEELFLERARRVRPAIGRGDGDAQTIRRICERLERLPLAIELAAARTRLFPLRQLLARLDDRFALLASELRDVPLRQRTLRGAIDWSFDLLSGPEQALFGRLSVFVGSADIEAIEAIVDPGGDLGVAPLDGVLSLIEKSLVVQGEGPDGTARFRMLETIRDYAAERLAQDPAAALVCERHARYFAALAELLEPHQGGADPQSFFGRLDADLDNLRAAMAWSAERADPALGLRIGAAIWRFWQQRGHLSEGRDRLSALLTLPARDMDQAIRARALSALGGVLYWQGESAEARRVYEEALRIRRDVGEPAGVAQALYDLGFTIATSGDLESARVIETESATLFEAVGDDASVMMVRESLAAFALMAGDLVVARELEETIVDEYRRSGYGFKLADGLSLLTVIVLRLGDTVAARRHLGESIALSGSIGDTSATAASLQFGAMLALAEGRPEDAARLCGALAATREQQGPVLTPVETLRLPDPAEEARAQLGAEAYELAYAEGRTWDAPTAAARVLP